MTEPAARACYPGSFDPLTVAHVAIASAVLEQCDGVASVDLVLSRDALGKPAPSAPVEERARAVEAAGWRAVVTDAQLLADVAAGYDVLVLGADKWAQLHDVAFYGGSGAARDAALARLPARLAVAPRHGLAVPAARPGVTVLSLPAWVSAVSSTAVRAGQAEGWRWPGAGGAGGAAGGGAGLAGGGAGLAGGGGASGPAEPGGSAGPAGP